MTDSAVQRYSIQQKSDSYGQYGYMQESSFGDYVKYSDYKKVVKNLQQQIDALSKKIKTDE